MSTAQKPGFLSSVLDPLTGSAVLRTEKARLEAFLDAVPGEYCGFAKDGSVIYSDQFSTLLNLQKIASIHDIQGALGTADAAALEGQFLALQEKQKPFSSMPCPATKQKRSGSAVPTDRPLTGGTNSTSSGLKM